MLKLIENSDFKRLRRRKHKKSRFIIIMYKKVLFLGLALAMSFVFTASSFAADGILTAAINPLMTNADIGNPTGVRGQMEVKIASFNLIALKSRKGVSVNKIVVKNNSDKDLALAKDFQNLKLKHDGIQIAPTMAVLSPWASAKYAFIPSTAINILPGQQYTIDVYADSLTNAVNVNRAYSAVSLDKVMGINLFTNSAVGWGTQYNLSGEADIIGQNVYVAPKGSLLVGMANTPPAQNVAMGMVGQTLAVFKFSASSVEDVNVDKISVTDTISGIATATPSIIYLKIFSDNGTQIGNTVVSMTPGNNSNAIATFDNVNFAIPKNQSRTLTLKGDTDMYNAASGSIHKFGILSPNDITAIGMASAQTISVNGTPAQGNGQILYRAESTVANAMSNITGGAMMQQQIGKYTFTNTSPNNYSVIVSNIDLGINSTIDNYATTSVKLYKNFLGGTLIAEKLFIGGADFSAINNWDFFTPFIIDAAGGYGSMDIFVVADTWSATATDMISTSIRAVTWSDGISQSNSIDNTPIIGATVIY